MIKPTLLSVHDLCVSLPGRAGLVQVVDHVSFSLNQGEVLGLVGESGSGKSVTCSALMGLLPPEAAVSGSASFQGRDLMGMSKREMQDLRGGEVGFVFQDPMTSLNPTMKIREQIAEVLRRHRGMGRRAAADRARELLSKVGIERPNLADAYPHEYSGGMRQRALIAMAVACEPKLVIADEPTTALDVTIQAQVLDLLREMTESMGLSLLFISHDLAVVAQVCDRVLVMYGGQVIEQAEVDAIFESPRHPYTRALLAATQRDPGSPLQSMRGAPVVPGQWPTGCRFRQRCDFEESACGLPQELKSGPAGHSARCHLSGEAA